MSLETMRPNPTWDAASYDEAVETLAAHSDELTYKIWGGDWCKDCRALLPDFGAALEAAEVPGERIEEFALDQDKEGPGVEEYDIELIPTIVVENDDEEEITRFVEEEDVPPAVWLADEIETAVEAA
ncbi:TlpA family protein disulfide reductase [Natrinema halophilum]|uniref:Thioredoxin family protein n=1 Tax=Natrinema halophilum TaxID=1699371 RepID=A0A7D5KB56_9EURY|nr:thioredoxin domain-containing protein [Natrinema halophilum]QLG47556.1 thioredoxin domain-containing protein [Natrinema halophilum]